MRKISQIFFISMYSEHTNTVAAVCSLCEAKKGEKFPFLKKVTLPVGCFCARKPAAKRLNFHQQPKKSWAEK